VERPVKSNLPLRLGPVADGWALHTPSEPVQVFSTLEEAAAALKSDTPFNLELPCTAVLFERMSLPATDREELLSMARLQLEKTLPFPPEEVSSDIAVISRGETESNVLAIAVHNEHLDTLCAPLRARHLIPESVSVRVLQEAAACPSDPGAMLLFREGESLVIAFSEKSNLTYATTTEGVSDEAMLLGELPQLVMSAEMEGISSDFSQIFTGPACAEFNEALGEFFKLPVRDLPSLEGPYAPVVNLLPEPWLEERRQLAQKANIRQKLALAAMVYVALLVGACAYLISLDMRARSLQRKVALSQPLVQQLQDEQSRWQALAPAVDPKLFTVELLNQITNSIPSPDLRITEFNQEPKQVTVKAEAPSANSAIDFGERLKSNSALNKFRFDMAPPQILANNRAQVNIFGKL